nr:G-type lectin S-receptor-like serine/threonine-protein kinase At4g27290 [Ipomoea batatas]
MMRAFFLKFLFSLLLFSFHNISYASDTITPTQSLKDGETIISSGGSFEMGFFSPTNSQNRYVGIWYNQIPNRTVVWVANRDTPLTNTSSVLLKIINPGFLALVDGNNNATIWHTNTSRQAPNPVAKLLDSGNLVVTENANDESPENFLWQSFDHPTDTQLPGMKLGTNFVTGLEVPLSAWKAENNPGRGEYELHIEPKGYPQSIMRKGGNKVYRSGSWNGLRWGGTHGIQKKSYVIDTSVIINTNEVSTSFKVHNSSDLVRMVLTSTGSILLYKWADETEEWKTLRNAPTDVCDTYGSCGAYGSCNYDNFPVCGCLDDKFLPRDKVAWGKSDFSGGCVRRTPLNCQNVTSNGFLKYSGIKLPDTEFTWFNSSMNLQECEQVCLKNCSCMAYSSLDISNGQNGCLLWFSDLIDIRALPEQGQDLYIRMASSDLDYPSSSKRKKSKRIKLTSILVGILVLGLILIVVIILYKRKKKEINLKLKWEEDQILFEVSTITRATNNFSLNNKIGEGGYGPVYKGVLDDRKEIAVKRLSKTSKQGLGEFKNEVNSIARLQHRNLVKLLGWCIQGDEKMLIYEYMPNKSLDSYIFGTTFLS